MRSVRPWILLLLHLAIFLVALPVAEAGPAKLPKRVGVVECLVTSDASPPEAGGNRWVALGKAAPAEHLVVLIHGLDEPGTIWDELAPLLASDGHAVARFNYPDDQALSDSGEQLGHALESLWLCGTRRVSLVCFSMGGLIARDVLTSPVWYQHAFRGSLEGAGPHLPDLERMITVGTPNAGSEMARFRLLLELEERIRQISAESPEGSAFGAALFNDDGDGKAGRDLLPGSIYLTELNSRPIPDDLPITIVIGRMLSPYRGKVAQTLASPRVRRVVGQGRVDWALGSLTELSAVVGDGVVTIESACLPGVRDVVMVDGDHRSMLQRRSLFSLSRPTRPEDFEKTPEPPAIAIIRDRLARSAAHTDNP